MKTATWGIYAWRVRMEGPMQDEAESPGRYETLDAFTSREAKTIYLGQLRGDRGQTFCQTGAKQTRAQQSPQ